MRLIELNILIVWQALNLYINIDYVISYLMNMLQWNSFLFPLEALAFTIL